MLFTSSLARVCRVIFGVKTEPMDNVVPGSKLRKVFIVACMEAGNTSTYTWHESYVDADQSYTEQVGGVAQAFFGGGYSVQLALCEHLTTQVDNESINEEIDNLLPHLVATAKKGFPFTNDGWIVVLEREDPELACYVKTQLGNKA